MTSGVKLSPDCSWSIHQDADIGADQLVSEDIGESFYACLVVSSAAITLYYWMI